MEIDPFLREKQKHMSKPITKRPAGRLNREKLTESISEQTQRSLIDQFKEEVFKTEAFFDEVRSRALKIRTVPNPSKNPHLSKRNTLLQLFKDRAWAGETVLMEKMKPVLINAKGVLETYEQRQQGEGITPEKVTEKVQSAVQKKMDQLINPSLPQGVEEELKKQMQTLKRVRKDCRKMLQELNDELAWQSNPRELRNLQKLEEALPQGYGISTLLRMEQQAPEEAIPALELKNLSLKLKEIGKGAFGVVYRSKKTTGEDIVLKCYQAGREEQALKEYRMLSAVRNELDDHLVSPLAVWQVDKETAKKEPKLQEGQLLIEYPFIDGDHPAHYLNDIVARDPDAKVHELEGGVYDYLRPIRQLERNCAAMTIIMEVANALKSMHDAGLVHQDTKPENMQVTPDGEAYLLDMGEVMRRGEFAEKLAGSPRYMAPEALDVQGYHASPSIDVYALGMTAYSLFTGDQDPFQEASITETLKKESPGISDIQLKAEMLLEMGQRKRDIEEFAHDVHRNPFHQDHLEKKIYKAPLELISLIQRSLAASEGGRITSMEEFLKEAGSAFQVLQERLAELRQKQKRSEKTQEKKTDRYSRKQAEADAAEKKRREEQQLKKEQEKTEVFFGTNVTRTYSPATKTEAPAQEKEPTPEEIERRKDRNKKRSRQFYS